MSEDNVATLMARREYDKAVPLLKQDLEKYPNNVRIRLQYADALAGAGMFDEALDQYERTSQFYEESGLIVQAIGVRKKAEKVGEKREALQAEQRQIDPTFARSMPSSPLFENLSKEELDAVVAEMALEEHEEGDVIIREGDEGSSLFVLVSGEAKVYTRGKKDETLYLAKLGEGDFFGEISLLTGRKRTATITAGTRVELLRLDRDRYDRLAGRYPRIRQILDDFYQKRAAHTVEAMIDNLRKR